MLQTTRVQVHTVLARKTQHRQGVAAGIAAQAQEAAIEVGAQLALDEAGNRRAQLARVGEEGLAPAPATAAAALWDNSSSRHYPAVLLQVSLPRPRTCALHAPTLPGIW
jgi:hypothetical protein